MCVCIYIYICICIHIYIYIHTYIHYNTNNNNHCTPDAAEKGAGGSRGSTPGRFLIPLDVCGVYMCVSLSLSLYIYI